MIGIGAYSVSLLARPPAKPNAEILIVGAGISGLSAALEAAREGAKVTVIEMSSVFGGHAIMSRGGVSIVGTPTQQSSKIEDTPELAYNDFMKWGEDADPGWVRYYVDHSRAEIYDWLTPMGVVFQGVIRPDGNTVPRFHLTKGTGFGLVSPLYRECLKNPNIKFKWNIRMRSLISRHNRVIGVAAEELRTGTMRNFYADAVILATGGFQSNLVMVQEFWPKSLSFPDRLLLGAGYNAVASGHLAAQQVGATLYNMDHQWNYALGLPDPRHPGKSRGLPAFNPDSIWVNAQGHRFVNEFGSNKENFPALLNQKPPTYWAIFDEQGKRSFNISLAGWTFQQTEEIILSNPDLVKSSSTIEELAAQAGLPVSTLAETVRRYNQMIEQGEDKDFGRFGPGRSPAPAKKIEEPPFYAVQLFPVTRKSMGGIRVDLSCRVLDGQKRPIPGLYAVGELIGFAGINGKAGLEGTFLGPAIVTGRVAGRAVSADLKIPKPNVTAAPSAELVKTPASTEQGKPCQTCHKINLLISKSRGGYWHFEKSHGLVLDRKWECGQCHSELSPYRRKAHRIDRLAQVNNCKFCHVTEEH
jgi:uncharacterized protein